MGWGYQKTVRRVLQVGVRVKIKHTNTLKDRVLFALVCIMILQCIVFSCCILLTGTVQALDDSASSVFENSVKTNAKPLEEKLVSWTNLNKYEEDISKIVENLASKKFHNMSRKNLLEKKF